MPLHLLGKKSWNVYNPENVARVRRDEAQAKAREEEEERRMQEADAERRIQVLRGQRPSTPPPPPPPSSQPLINRKDRSHTGDEVGRHRKRRRLAGENDTDRDIRFAREDATEAFAKREELALSRGGDDAPLVDKEGHINLFPSKAGSKPVEKNTEAEADLEKNKRKFEDQYTMRFSNAAGFNQSISQNPWYSSSANVMITRESTSGKDVWGNEDPMRREREMARLDASDPLAAMRKGIRQLKNVEQQRKDWREERRKELQELNVDDSQRSSHGRHRRRKRSVSRRRGSEDSLDSFRLDAPPEKHWVDDDRNSSRRHDRDRIRGHSDTRNHSHSHSHRHRHRHRHYHHRHRERHDNERH